MDKEEIWSAVLERIGRKRFGFIDEEELMAIQYRIGRVSYCLSMVITC